MAGTIPTPDSGRLIPVAAAIVLAALCTSAAGGATPAPAPKQGIASTAIGPAMDLLLAPLDQVFSDGFE